MDSRNDPPDRTSDPAGRAGDRPPTFVAGFGIGKCLSRSLQIWKQNWVLYTIPCLVLYSIPELLQGFALHGEFGHEALLYQSNGFIVYIIQMPNDVLSYLADGIVSIFALTKLSGGTPTLASLRKNTNIGAVTALIVFALIDAVVLGLADQVYFFPYIIFAVIFALTVPAIVEEKLNALGAMRRSFILSSGFRWKLFGLVLVFILMALSVYLPVGGTFRYLIFAESENGWDRVDPIVNLVLAPLYSYFIVCITVAYYDIRSIREDLDNPQVLEVFD